MGRLKTEEGDCRGKAGTADFSSCAKRRRILEQSQEEGPGRRTSSMEKGEKQWGAPINLLRSHPAGGDRNK